MLPEAARRVAAWCVVALLVSGVGAVVIWLCVQLKAAVTPVLLALLGTGLLGPMFRRLVRMRMNRSLAAGLTCLVLVAVVGGAGYIVVSALIDTGDEILASLKKAARKLSGHFGTAGSSLEDLAANGKELLGRFGGTAASEVISGISVVGEVIGMAVLALLLTFFFLRDGHRVMAAVHRLSPRRGTQLEAMGGRALAAIEGFMRGTTIIALIDAVLITAGLVGLGVPGAAGLGALVFVGAYIPYLGAFLSGTVAVLVALAHGGLSSALWVLGVVVAVQVIEGHLLQPIVQSRTVQMHPAVVMVAIAGGAAVAGIVGMLLAVPLTAAAFGILSEIHQQYTGGSTLAPDPRAPRGGARGGGSGTGPPGGGASGAGPSTGGASEQ
ncbi:AI-2E family transporter [Streptomyces palmae]|uniref:AI-2E family transporter n=1 Tax=Streptomyces palmae TaxID=1701085 RepID=A0A4Z0GND4_9ACTN|nr:AI-2E family transporter [Streptomyces palmae]